MSVRHFFVEYIPTTLDEGVVYISLRFGTAVHLCCCGCGNEVVTPLTPVDWNMSYDGETISLHPSVGNWSLKCQSHYWITRGRVHWARKWSDEKIEQNRAIDQTRRARFLDSRRDARVDDESPKPE